jgi:hypothetical protein
MTTGGWPSAADEPDRIDIEQQCGRASPVGRLGIEDVSRAERQRARVHPTRARVEELAEVGRGRPGERDRQQHQLSRKRFIEQPQLVTSGEKGHQLGDAKS